MKILLSNDDGYYAEGIQALIKELSIKHEIFVAAPLENNSAGSSALSTRKDINVDNVKKNHYVIDGTPADCVHIALTCLIKEKIDIVVSGINMGANLGDDVIYSGTVAAALEGRHLEFSPIAISLITKDVSYLKNAAQSSSYLFEKIIENKIINKKTLLNINIPDSNNLIKDFKYTRLGKRGTPIPAKKIKEKNLYNIGAAGDPKDNGEGTDFFVTNNNIISITPITYDLTNSKILEELNNS